MTISWSSQNLLYVCDACYINGKLVLYNQRPTPTIKWSKYNLQPLFCSWLSPQLGILEKTTMMLSQPVLEFVQCESLCNVILTTTSSPPPLYVGLIHNGVFVYFLFCFLLTTMACHQSLYYVYVACSPSPFMS